MNSTHAYIDHVNPHQTLELSPPPHTPLLVRQEQVRLLYRPSLTAAVTSIFVAIALAYIQWPAINHDVITRWLAFMGLTIAARIIAHFTFFKVDPGPEKVLAWERASVTIAILASVAWGSAGVFLFPEQDFPRQAATTVVLAGMASGAVTTLSALRRPVYIFLASAMLPLTFSLFAASAEIGGPVAFLCLVYTLFLAISAHHNYTSHLQNISLRIKSRERELAIRRSERSVQKSAEILRMIALGEPAEKIFNAVALLYEGRHPGIRCSMLKLEGNRLLHGGAPSLPVEYCDAVNGLEIGPEMGSCGAATYSGKRVLVEDIERDPKWMKLKDYALPHGLRSCWSEPIKSTSGQVLGVFGMYRDRPALPTSAELDDLESAAQLAGIVIEREQREALLSKLSTSLEQSGEAVMITNTEGVVEYVNSAFSRNTGYSLDDLIDEAPCVFALGDQEFTLLPELREVLSGGKSWAKRVVARRKNGRTYPAQLTVAPVKDPSGKISHYIGSHVDLSAQLRLEEQLRQKYKMEALGVMSGGIAHNFNNKLAVILGNLELAHTKVPEGSRVHTYLNNARAAVSESRDLILQILSYRKKQGQNKCPVRLVDVVEESQALLRSAIPSSVNFHQEIAQDSRDATVFADLSELQTIILRLVNNAVQAMNEKGDLTLALCQKEIFADDIPAHFQALPGRFAVLSIQDNGCGMDLDVMDKIFDPFFTTRAVGQGSGMGLSGVKGMVEGHNGFIRVRSQKGAGSTFELYFPLIDQSCTQAARRSQLKNLRGGAERVLFIDDEARLAELGERILSSEGYQVTAEVSSVRALELIRHDPDRFDLVVTDQTMPELSGKDLLVEVKKIRPDLPTIIITGYSNQISAEEASALGIDAYCAKPLNMTEMLQVVRGVLDEA